MINPKWSIITDKPVHFNASGVANVQMHYTCNARTFYRENKKHVTIFTNTTVHILKGK